MRRLLLLTCLLAFVNSIVLAQDVPLFTQKLTNSFLYNPSVAGNSIGSLTLSHRKYYSGTLDAPSTNFFSAHIPFGKYNYGTGINFYQDKNGVTENLYASAAFAYHVRITDEKIFSMGLSGEFNNQRLNPLHYDAVDQDDESLNQNTSVSGVDFSFGLSFRSKYFSLGASANRLKALTGMVDGEQAFPAYYSATTRLMLPMAGERDLLEPMVTFRGFLHGSNQVDAGIFYTYNDLVTLGGTYRTTGGSGAVNATAGIKIFKAVTIGYSRDLYLGDVSKGLGATNEFTLRFDYMNEAFYTKVRNSRVINTKALALRRKTLSTFKYRGSPGSHSKHYQRTIKRKAYMSPNYRMDSSKKLQTMRRKTKSTYKRKPTRRRR